MSDAAALQVIEVPVNVTVNVPVPVDVNNPRRATRHSNAEALAPCGFAIIDGDVVAEDMGRGEGCLYLSGSLLKACGFAAGGDIISSARC